VFFFLQFKAIKREYDDHLNGVVGVNSCGLDPNNPQGIYDTGLAPNGNDLNSLVYGQQAYLTNNQQSQPQSYSYNTFKL